MRRATAARLCRNALVMKGWLGAMPTLAWACCRILANILAQSMPTQAWAWHPNECFPTKPSRLPTDFFRLGCLFAGLLVLLGATRPCPAADPKANYSRGVLIRFEGPITPMLQQYFYRKLDVARQRGADLVIVEIESPGGYVEESLAIARRLRDVDWAHTVAYVPKEALSGAAIAALGCDEIVMHPTAVFGDAGPIFLGEDALFRHAPEKIRSDLARRVRDLAEAKGRPPALAEAMVDMDLVVYRVVNTQSGEIWFMSDAEIDADDDPKQWKKDKPVIESRKDHFLELNGVRAVEVRLAEGNASSRDDLRRRYGLAEELSVLEPGGVDTAVYILNLPLITGLLFVIGLVALYVEFSAPGIGLGGLTAGLCFSLFFWSRFLGGTAGWLEVVLFAAGIVFLMVELFVLPGFGIAGLSGILLLVVSLILAGQTFLVPTTARELTTLTHTVLVILGSGVAFTCSAFALSSYLGEIPILNRLTLRPPEPNESLPGEAGGDRTHYSGVQIGEVGISDSPLRPAGKARFGNQYVDVLTDGLLVGKGARVKVVKIGGNRVVVREVAQDE